MKYIKANYVKEWFTDIYTKQDEVNTKYLRKKRKLYYAFRDMTRLNDLDFSLVNSKV